jgi:hypothetical protein
MTITTHSPIYQKAFEQYLRRGTPIEISLKRMMKALETSDNHTTALYIWRTAGDDKVRPSHAANEGKIFAWANPPDTGNPGEDYNCRCTAEPIEVDTTPLEILALLSGAGIVRRVGVRVGGEIIRRIERGREDPLAQKPAEPAPLPKPEGIPKHWEASLSNKGEGVRYRDPKNIQNEVRVQKGNPNSSNPAQQKDYVKWKKQGKFLDKNGNQLPNGDVREAHIPIDKFKFNQELFK